MVWYYTVICNMIFVKKCIVEMAMFCDMQQSAKFSFRVLPCAHKSGLFTKEYLILQYKFILFTITMHLNLGVTLFVKKKSTR